METQQWWNPGDVQARAAAAVLFHALAYKADLRDADLRGADLCGADLCGADLSGADLCGADLSGAIGVVAVQNVLSSGRDVFGYIYDKQIRIQAGCRNDTLEAMRGHVIATHGDDSDNTASYMAALAYIETTLRGQARRCDWEVSL